MYDSGLNKAVLCNLVTVPHYNYFSYYSYYALSSQPLSAPKAQPVKKCHYSDLSMLPTDAQHDKLRPRVPESP
jgi:hypothetical protein